MTQPSSEHGAAGTATNPAEEGPMTRQARSVGDWFSSLRAHPIKGALLTALVFAVGIFAGEGAERVLDTVAGPDDYLVQIKQEQEKQFEALQANLGDLKRSLDGESGEAFAQVRDAVDAITDTNVQLIQQLALAKREYQTLSKVAEQKAGVSGGYDFILAEGNGLRIDPQTTVGLYSVGSRTVRVNLTSSDEDRSGIALNTGEAVSYTSSDDQACKLTLLSFNDARVGTASFAKSCTPTG